MPDTSAAPPDGRLPAIGPSRLRGPAARARRSRPLPADGRLTPAGERLLDAASELFYLWGIHAVGVDTIAEAAGTTKKTLYDRFGSKDALVALYLQRRAERWQAFVEAHLRDHASERVGVNAGVSRVLAVFDALEAWYAELIRGCAFVNAYAEIGGIDHPGVAVIRAEKEWTHALYVRLLTEAGVDDAALRDAVGAQLMLVHEGVSIMLTAGGRADAFDSARTAARRLLDGVA
ncbi:TetR/AcrR family transcriptional regulator [Phytoactinopolyspora alkaliphila]|uniref:TetR/AcrR family transcriptional regulator n=1 Tax=Phytoactinopolyspora alkaliphila TaxID=1783498 RepID=A0A6N9YQA2_9ACTN|nr:TetR/AcrR family transcriptional regulator [Phytoactinopolyspora alkaliphila]NED97231.1 TetR/AcrR family transcriptional regulator [Phytoactinopolyspora alkaliphila]